MKTLSYLRRKLNLSDNQLEIVIIQRHMLRHKTKLNNEAILKWMAKYARIYRRDITKSLH